MRVEADARRDVLDALTMGSLHYDDLTASGRQVLPGLIRDGLVIEKDLTFRLAHPVTGWHDVEGQ